jgi:hypothetical protein
MAGIDPGLRSFLVAVACVLAIAGIYAALRRARRSGRAMQSFAMMTMLFGWGSMRDPRNDTVAEAQDGRIRRGDESGDPPP